MMEGSCRGDGGRFLSGCRAMDERWEGDGWVVRGMMRGGFWADGGWLQVSNLLLTLAA